MIIMTGKLQSIIEEPIKKIGVMGMGYGNSPQPVCGCDEFDLVWASTSVQYIRQVYAK
jgi:hypothetical protein